MKRSTCSVEAWITPDVYREFALFDTLIRRRAWQRPVLFAVLMGAFAAVCFVLRNRSEQAILLGGVLLLVGLGLPACYIGQFLWSVRVQARKLDRTRAAYTIFMDEEGVTVTAGADQVRRPWNSLAGAWRLRTCVCLYASNERAWLLPTEQKGTDGDKIWSFVTAHLPPERCAVRR